MEIQDSSNNSGYDYSPVRRNNGILVIAVIFIAVGLLLFARNFGFVNDNFTQIVVSWQMLLIVLGISMLVIRRRPVPGAILIGIGGFFMLPKFVGYAAMETYWPLVFVVVGLVLLVTILGANAGRKRYDERR